MSDLGDVRTTTICLITVFSTFLRYASAEVANLRCLNVVINEGYIKGIIIEKAIQTSKQMRHNSAPVPLHLYYMEISYRHLCIKFNIL
jgi:hypothetical protein